MSAVGTADGADPSDTDPRFEVLSPPVDVTLGGTAEQQSVGERGADRAGPPDATAVANLVRDGSLSVRTGNRLLLAGLATVGDVRRLGLEAVALLRGMGTIGISEVAALLAESPPACGVQPAEAAPAGPVSLPGVDAASGTEPLAEWDRTIADAQSGGWEAGEAAGPDAIRLSDLMSHGALSVRTANCLISAGFLTLGDVRRVGLERLSRLRGVGAGALRELTEALRIAAAGASAEAVGSPGPFSPAAVGPRQDESGLASVPSERHDRIATVEDLVGSALAVLTGEDLSVLDRRDRGETLQEIGDSLGVTRERVRQIEARTRRRLGQLGAPDLVHAWDSRLDETGWMFEDELVEAPEGARREAAVLLARAYLIAVRPDWRIASSGVSGERVVARGASVIDDLFSAMRDLGELGPYLDEDLDEAFDAFGIRPRAGRRLLVAFPGVLAYHDTVRGWVRRSARTRDACALVLGRAGHPLTAELLGTILKETPRNISAHLDRDGRFRRLSAMRRWALVAWGDLGEGTRYRSARDAIIDVLSESGPLTMPDLIERVLARHPVTQAAVRIELEHELFGHWPDGRIGMAFQGGVVHEDDEPSRPPSVDPPEGSRLNFHIPVDGDVLRGSGIGIPKYVAWFAGLRKVPRHRTFEDDRGRSLTVRRTQLAATISSLRVWARASGVGEGCLMTLTLNVADETCAVVAGCPCHAQQ